MSHYDALMNPAATLVLTDRAEGSAESAAVQILNHVCAVIPLLAPLGHADTESRLTELSRRLRLEIEAWLSKGSGATHQSLSIAQRGELSPPASGRLRVSVRLEIGRQ